jgi:surface polysaccharide O-acyltransferase-like enzyme
VNKRLDNLDLLKSIAMIDVIFIHCYFLENNFINNPSIETFIGYIFRMFIEGVPIFVFVNGYLMFSKDYSLKKIINKIFKIIFILFIYAFIYYIIYIVINNQTFSIKESIITFLNTNINDEMHGFLWFLQSLSVVYILYPVLKYIYDNNSKLFDYLFIIILIFSVGINLVNLILNPITNILEMKSILPALNNFINSLQPFTNISFLSFFMLGAECLKYKDIILKNKNKVIIIGIVGIVIPIIYGILISFLNKNVYSNNFMYNTIFMLTFLVLLYISTINFKNNNLITKIITGIGKNSMGIYLTHQAFIKVFLKYLNLPFSTNINKFVICIIVLILSNILTIIIKKIPLLNKMISI